ncbi:MAG: sulfur carrier protein ThiS adenylyltransferase ThiF [Clostridia bacterium]|nr:sulfur carrier protein ThiS adenylyltransferase ThiF [Clostridia bacterium]
MIPSKDDFERIMIERHTLPVYETLRSASAAIAGLGGLGSNIAVSLTRTGVGRLMLVDFDRVELSNLNRQQYFVRHIGRYKTEALTEILRDINPYVEIHSQTVRVTEENASEIFKDYNIVCEAFDRPENKAMLINTLLTENNDKIIVSGSGMAGYIDANAIKTRRITDRLYICGDGVTDAADVNGLMAPRVAVCANHQANAVIRLMMDEMKQ